MDDILTLSTVNATNLEPINLTYVCNEYYEIYKNTEFNYSENKKIDCLVKKYDYIELFQIC